MNFEQPSKVESKEDDKIIKLTEEESDILTFSKNKLDDPEFLKLMEEKGISFDSGDIVFEVDGKKGMMTTRKDDFGTWLLPETIEKLYGKEKREEIES